VIDSAATVVGQQIGAIGQNSTSIVNHGIIRTHEFDYKPGSIRILGALTNDGTLSVAQGGSMSVGTSANPRDATFGAGGAYEVYFRPSQGVGLLNVTG
jgi:hypothetical protein